MHDCQCEQCGKTFSRPKKRRFCGYTCSAMAKSLAKRFATLPCSCGDHCFTRSGRWAVLLVSPEDRDLLKQFTWTIVRMGRNFYAVSEAVKGHAGIASRLLHQHVLDAPLLDHENRNGLDSRRSNVRRATHTQNQGNRRKRRGTVSRYKGVIWTRDKWVAQLRTLDKQMWLGSFSSEDDAALAYNFAAVEYFGEFATLNHASH